MTPLTCLCRHCRQLITGTILPVNQPLPPNLPVADDRRESFRRWVGFVAVVGEHVARFHPEVLEGARQLTERALGIMTLALVQEIDSTDPDLAYWRGVIGREVEGACQSVGLVIGGPDGDQPVLVDPDTCRNPDAR